MRMVFLTLLGRGGCWLGRMLRNGIGHNQSSWADNRGEDLADERDKEAVRRLHE
jgi:hypothetical protein